VVRASIFELESSRGRGLAFAGEKEKKRKKEDVKEPTKESSPKLWRLENSGYPEVGGRPEAALGSIGKFRTASL